MFSGGITVFTEGWIAINCNLILVLLISTDRLIVHTRFRLPTVGFLGKLNMKINITKKEYRLLLDILYLGEWMLTAHDQEEIPEKEEYQDVIQKFYSYAKEMGYENLIEADKESNKYYETREYEDTSEVHEIIDNYDNATFWGELVSELAMRDAKEIKGNDAFNKMSPEERIQLLHPLEEKYHEEFMANDLANLQIKK